MKRKLISGVLSALLLACVCALGGCSGRTVIDLADYVSVEFSGYDGDGTAHVSVDSAAILPLVEEQNSPIAIAGSFTAAAVENNGKLSNGDTISVSVNFSEKMMENAKIDVRNSSLSFTVSGLKEKDKLDVFANVEFISEGTSPECTVSLKYSGGYPYETFELITESGEIITGNFESRKFANGEKVTVRLTESALEELVAQYLIEETSRGYTVTSDSSYILSPTDLSGGDRETLDKIAEDFLNEKIADLLSDKDRAARVTLLSQASGMNAGSIYAGVTWRIEDLNVKGLNSAYVGTGDVVGNWGVEIHDKKSIYYLYDAEFNYYIKQFFDVYEDSTECTFIVRVDEPKTTPEGVMYSGIVFGSAKDFNTAYNSYITSKFEKLP
ncbi:MAG: hypothetical protein NC299_13930 [Lachnospiraceae bacterium]|nr:hypothetical protein [Ruminococcus sp.]MCM1276435.1 hypothetical protein [Lachnospiraceae bacterium]